MKIRKRMETVLLVIGFLGFIVSGLDAKEVKVNCDKGESVQKALDDLDGASTIIVTGVCQENIDIMKDDVTIQGGSFVGPDPQQSTIYIEGARRVFIKQTTVGGAGNGIAASQGATLTVVESSIQGNGKAGIVVNFGSSAVVDNCIMQNNAQQGVVVTDNSALVLTNSTVTINGTAGVLVQRSSSARIGRSIAGVSGLNTITNNGGSGINVSRSAYALIDGNTITVNSGNGVNIEGSTATITMNTITYNNKGINVENSANARIGVTEGGEAGRNTVENNILEGIQSANGGAAFIYKNTIRNNGLNIERPGVGIYRATGRLIGDNIIEGNGGHGVTVNQGTLFQGKGDWNLTPTPGPDVIQSNSLSGIRAWNGASLDISKAVITGNGHHGISMVLHSTLNLYDSIISGNSWDGIWLEQGSVANLGSPQVSITNNTQWGILCDGKKSNLAGNTSGVTENLGGQVSPSCTGF